MSKSDHLDWAMAIFQRGDVFKTAAPLACHVDRADSITPMEKHLKTYNHPRVRQRLQQLKDGFQASVLYRK